MESLNEESVIIYKGSSDGEQILSETLDHNKPNRTEQAIKREVLDLKKPPLTWITPEANGPPETPQQAESTK